MFSKQPTQVDELADQIGKALRERGETLASMLAVLREERDRAFPERYPEAGEASDREDKDDRQPRS
jgi:hypothetical protein